MLRGTQTTTNNYLIKQLPRATAFIDREFALVYVSDRWITDFDFGNRNILGKNIFELFESVSREMQSVMEACLLGKEGGTGTEKFVDQKGNTRWFEWTNIPWFDEKENIIGLIIQSEEVTERIQEKQEFEKVRMILKDQSQIGLIGSWEYDASDDKLHWCEMTRLIHEVPTDYSPNIDTAIDFYKEGYSRNTISMAVYNAMKNGTPWSEKLQLKTATGREIWVIASGKALFKQGEYAGLLGTFQDITAFVHSEIKIKESEELLRTVVDNLPINVYIKDLESRKLLVNKAECNYLGVKDPEELLGKSDFELYDPEIAQISRDEDLAVMNSMTPILGKETINVRQDGSATTFLTSKIPLSGDDGKAYGLLGISLDISHLKKQEGELRHLINVTSLQNKKLVNFAHIVSHNLRSHTANFSMLVNFLKTENDEEEKNKIVAMLSTATDNLLETLENLQEVVTINTNISLEKKPVNLCERISSVSSSLSTFMKQCDAELINEVPEDTIIKAVPAYIDSILMNFITNAVKYRHPDRTPVIRLSVNKTLQFTVLSFQDNGLGIDLKRYGDKLFGMYKTFHENAEARGIGLYITKNQVEAMNGKITTKSKVGEGTTFNVHFNEKN